MRLSFICPSISNGGLEMTVHRLARACQQRGMEVLIAAPHGSPVSDSAHRDGISTVHFLPKRKYGDLGAARRLADALKEFGTTHGVLFRSQDIHLAALSHRRAPSVIWSFYQQMQSAVPKRDLIHRWMFSHLSAWLTLTERMRQDVLRCTTMPQDRVSVVFLGRDLQVFDPARVDQTKARISLGLPQHGPIIGMIGRLDPQKGQAEFIEAASIILRSRPEVMFVIAGEATRTMVGVAESLQARVRELGLTEYIRFLPHSEDVASMLAALDIFVMPSHSETYGLILLEAMAMQRPIIATDAGGVPELARNGSEAILVPPKDPQPLADALEALISNAPLSQKLAASARKRAVELFDERVCVDSFLQKILHATPR